MEINSLQTQSGAAGVSAATSSEDTGVISSDFETFLVMLTAQIQNQDPLNPMDSSDYAVQLATFSGVEQQVLTNELLREGNEAGTQYDLVSLAGWVGLEAMTDGSYNYNGKDPLSFDVDIPKGTDWARLVIRDVDGNEVAEVSIDPWESEAVWNGKRADGTNAASGTYSAELKTYSEGDLGPVYTDIKNYRRITEVRQGVSGYELVLDGGTALPVDQVSALRSPTAGGSGTSSDLMNYAGQFTR